MRRVHVSKTELRKLCAGAPLRTGELLGLNRGDRVCLTSTTSGQETMATVAGVQWERDRLGFSFVGVYNLSIDDAATVKAK